MNIFDFDFGNNDFMNSMRALNVLVCNAYLQEFLKIQSEKVLTFINILILPLQHGSALKIEHV